jgi:hypothetical protein
MTQEQADFLQKRIDRFIKNNIERMADIHVLTETLAAVLARLNQSEPSLERDSLRLKMKERAESYFLKIGDADPDFVERLFREQGKPYILPPENP